MKFTTPTDRKAIARRKAMRDGLAALAAGTAVVVGLQGPSDGERAPRSTLMLLSPGGRRGRFLRSRGRWRRRATGGGGEGPLAGGHVGVTRRHPQGNQCLGGNTPGSPYDGARPGSEECGQPRMNMTFGLKLEINSISKPALKSKLGQEQKSETAYIYVCFTPHSGRN